jgi:hypothetical protein
VYDAYDEGGSSMLAPNYDMDSTPHHVYDIYDDACMIVPEYDKGWELCVEDDNDRVDLVDESRSENLFEERIDTEGFDHMHMFCIVGIMSCFFWLKA